MGYKPLPGETLRSPDFPRIPDGVRCLASTGTNARFPLHDDELVDVSGGHDSVTFYEASVPLFFCVMRLSDVVL